MGTELRVFLDVGSTNSRAWLVHGREVLARATAPVGVRDSARTGSTTFVREAVRALIAEVSAGESVALAVAAGMITSSLGVAEVPHVLAPAGVEDLASAAVVIDDPDLAPAPIALVPGVRTGAGEAQHGDVMRGEETLALGAVAGGLLPRGGTLLTAGSHWKLSRVDVNGRVAGSRTSLGGETVHAWQTATILRSSLPEGPLDRVDAAWVARGAAAARAEGLLRAAFQVRVLDQAGAADPVERFNWLVGAAVAADLDALLAAGQLTRGAAVLVSGPSAVPDVWAHLLRAADCVPDVLGPEAAEGAFIAGLDEVVRARGNRGLRVC